LWLPPAFAPPPPPVGTCLSSVARAPSDRAGPTRQCRATSSHRQVQGFGGRGINCMSRESPIAKIHIRDQASVPRGAGDGADGKPPRSGPRSPFRVDRRCLQLSPHRQLGRASAIMGATAPLRVADLDRPDAGRSAGVITAASACRRVVAGGDLLRLPAPMFGFCAVEKCRCPLAHGRVLGDVGRSPARSRPTSWAAVATPPRRRPTSSAGSTRSVPADLTIISGLPPAGPHRLFFYGRPSRS